MSPQGLTRFPKLVVNEGPPLFSDVFLELQIPEVPAEGPKFQPKSVPDIYELCDLGGQLVARVPFMRDLLKVMKAYPRRTVFLVRCYKAGRVSAQFHSEVQLSGRVRSWRVEGDDHRQPPQPPPPTAG